MEELLENKAMMDFGKDVLPAALDKYVVRAYLFDGYWEDIGTIKSFYEANLSLTRPDPHFDFFSPEGPVFTHARFLPPAKVYNCEVKDSLIAEGCVLHASKISDSIIGIRSIVNEGTRLNGRFSWGMILPQTGISPPATNFTRHRQKTALSRMRS